jgi:hypothetical protein
MSMGAKRYLKIGAQSFSFITYGALLVQTHGIQNGIQYRNYYGIRYFYLKYDTPPESFWFILLKCMPWHNIIFLEGPSLGVYLSFYV